jgi:hypothetical protein
VWKALNVLQSKTRAEDDVEHARDGSQPNRRLTQHTIAGGCVCQTAARQRMEQQRSLAAAKRKERSMNMGTVMKNDTTAARPGSAVGYAEPLLAVRWTLQLSAFTTRVSNHLG